MNEVVRDEAPTFGDPGWPDIALGDALERAAELEPVDLRWSNGEEVTGPGPEAEPDTRSDEERIAAWSTTDELGDGDVAAPPAERHQPSFVSVSTLLPPAAVDDWLVADLLRPRTLLVIAGAEGIGKSQLVAELGLRLAAGAGALFDHYPIPAPVRVAVVNMEMTPEETWRRESAILGRLGLERSDAADYFRVDSPDVSVPRDAAWLEQQLETVRPAVLILDTGTALVGEEWGPELKAAIRYLRSVAIRFDLAIVIAVHLTKPSRDKGRTRGVHGDQLSDVMGQWPRQVDAAATMADLGDGRVRWTTRKRIPHASLVLAQDDGLFRVVAVGDNAAPAGTDDRILAAISAGATDAREIVAALGIPRATVYRVIGQLRADGFVGSGKALELTPAGEEAVS